MMTDADFYRRLADFNADRFALAGLDVDEFGQFYHRLIGCFGHSAPLWYLIGTDGCHLCEQAAVMIERARPDAPLTTLDIIDAPQHVIAALDRQIPVLITPHTIMAYPFGVMDVVGLK